MMDCPETEYDRVVSKIFDGLNGEKLPIHKIMELIAPYIGDNRKLEFFLLKDILDPQGKDTKISRKDLKKGLQKWSDNLKSEKFSDTDEENSSLISNLDTSEKLHYIGSCGSMSSDGYRECILELQNEVAEKEHLVGKLKAQLELAAQHTQQHEEALFAIALERDQLRIKVQVDQQNNASFILLKEEYQYLLDTLNTYKEKSLTLQSNLDNLKTENTNINTKISNLDNEKYALTQMLFKTKEEKKKAIELLAEAQCNIEVLKIDCKDFTEKIQHQQETIQNLTAMKYSLEIDLQNTINRSSHYNNHHGVEERSDNEADPNMSLLLTLNKNVTKLEPMTSTDQMLDNIETNSVSRHVASYHSLTSTPRNELSLKQELHQIFTNPNISEIPDRISYSAFKHDLFKIPSSNEDTFFNFYDCSTDIFNSFSVNDNLMITDVTSNVNNADNLNCSNEIENNRKVFMALKYELHIEKNKNESLTVKLNENSALITEKNLLIESLLTKLGEMKMHEALLDLQRQTMNRAIREDRVKAKILQSMANERISWLKTQITSPTNKYFVDETQTDYPITNGQIAICPSLSKCTECTIHKRSTSRSWNFSSRIYGKLLFYGSIFCFSMACLQLYNTMKYCNVVKRGTYVRFYPWEWMSINEILSSIFDFKHTGHVPV